MKQAMFGARIATGALLLLGFGIAHARDAAAQSQPQSAPSESQSASSASPTLPDDWVKALNWRCIGPANMGGRITAIAVNENDPCTWWIATASGGLLKTMNSGFSFEHQFDRESTVSIGDVAVAQSNPEVVWVGTGEANPRNSVSWGDGVYKSSDGGKTWTNMGLKNSFQIGKIAIDPTNADIVYVGALGRLWGPSEERGLFKTIDGGKTWEKILYVDDKTGVIDVQLQPGSPNTILAATYERLRDQYDSNEPIKPTGPGAGIHKSTDGGKTWKKLNQGLPSSNLGRVGLNWYRKDPNIVYAIVESERIGQEPENAPFAGLTGEDEQVGARITNITNGGPAEHAGLKVGDIVVRLNETTIHSYDELVREMRKHVAGDTVKVEVSRDRKSVIADMTFDKRPEAREDQPPPPSQSETPGEGAPAAAGEQSPAGEAEQGQPGTAPRGARRPRGGAGGAQSQPAASQPARARTPFAGGLGGQRENIHEQQGPNGFEFGGVFMSTDAGETWKRINSINPRPMYFSEVRVDPNDNNYLWVLGISLYRSKDAGATFTDDGGNDAHADHHAMWIDPKDGRHIILGNDGGLYVTCDRGEHWDHLNHMAIGQFYHVAVDSRPNYKVYGGLQDNGSWGGPSRVRDGSGPINEDWISIGGGDGFVSFVDAEDPDQVYFCSQNGGMGARNLRTGDGWGIRPPGRRGVRYRWNWRTPYILSSHNSRIFYAAANYVFRSLDRGRDLKPISQDITNTDKGSATALAESPRDGDVLYVGTDDGALWMTRNGGHDWINLFDPPADDQQGGSALPPGAGGGGRRGGPGGPGGPGGRGNRGFSPEALRRMDANGNGSIERDEVPERMQQMFARLDRNSDGVIDSSEIDAAGTRGPQTQPAPQLPPGERGIEDANVQPTAATQPGAATQPVPPLPTTAPASQPEATPAATEPAAPTASAPAATNPAEPPASAPAADDFVTGTWEGQVLSDQLPPEQSKFSFSVKLEAGDKVSGSITTSFNQGDLTGTFNPASKRITLSFESPFRTVEYNGTINGAKMTGEANAGEGAFTFNFEANRVNREVAATPAEREAASKPEGKPIKELLPGLRYVSSIEPSRAAAARVYITFDGHRSNDDEPYVLVSEDYGRHWRSIRANLPTGAGSTKCIREDIVNRDILYLGTEFGAWISIDRGASWTKFNGNMPTVAVHDFAMHPTAGEIVAATHGRSLWVLDVTPIRQMKSEMLAQKASLFKPNEAVYWRTEPRHGGGTRRYVGQNPNNNASVYYCLTKPNQRVSLKVTTQAGETLRELDASTEPGLHRAEWDLRRQPQGGAAGPGGPGARTPNAARALGGGGGGGRFGRRGQLVPAGIYRVVLSVDDAMFTQDLLVETDPEHADYRPWETEEQQLEFEQMFEEHDDDVGAPDDPEDWKND